jgi:hypothetical protein
MVGARGTSDAKMLAGMQAASAAGGNLTQKEEVAAQAEYERTHLTRPVIAQQPERQKSEELSDMLLERVQALEEMEFGEETGVDEHGHAWVETWSTDTVTKIITGVRSGFNQWGKWSESWTKSAAGDIVLEGE